MGEGNPTTPDEMQNRIDRLEGLVLSLMSTGNPAASQAAAAALNGARSIATDQSQDMDQDVDGIDGKHGPRDEDSEVERVSNSIGIMKVQNDRNIYASEGHWYAILSDVSVHALHEHLEANLVVPDRRGQSMVFRAQETIR